MVNLKVYFQEFEVNKMFFLILQREGRVDTRDCAYFQQGLLGASQMSRHLHYEQMIWNKSSLCSHVFYATLVSKGQLGNNFILAFCFCLI